MDKLTENIFTDWAEKLRTSDRSAFKAFFDATYPSVVRYACGFTRDEASAHDIAQEVYVRLWSGRGAIDPKRSLRAVLYVSVRNLAFNRNRTRMSREKAHTIMDKPDVPLLPDDVLGVRELSEKIQAWIRELPARRREAFQLSRYDGLSYEEIGQIMGLSARTVEQHIRLALSTLRDRLKELEPDLLSP